MPDDQEDIDLEKLKRQTSHGDRLDTDADNDAQQELADAILDELGRIGAGEEQKTISVWDGPTAALVRALDDNPEQRAAVGKSLYRQLDVESDDDPIERSELVRYALRLGFKQAAPDTFEVLREAVQEYATQDL
jgi:6-phosphogluconate dehydrogenase